ncbi:hypothetical protein HQ545_03835 [Candidatus Woesearchaeota archaeon]|nr:hypothetical protein [Candidatus Woesearchaeota archaeon]
MDTSILENIGLTGVEIKVFIALLELGSSTAGNVVDRSGVQNAVVHRAFHSLIKKGLLTYVYQGKIKQYQTIEPKLLLNYLDEKKERIRKLIPELEAKKQLQKNKTRATIFQGVRGIKTLLNLMIDTESENYYAYGGPQKAEDILGAPFWEIFHKKRIERKIDGKFIFHQSLHKWFIQLNKKRYTEVKLTEENFEEVTETIICGSHVAIIIYLEDPFGFLIQEKSAAQSYERFFNILWKETQ